MPALRNFEMEVIRLVGASSLDQDQLYGLAQFNGIADYEYTGVGYYITLRMPNLPSSRKVLDRPAVMGEADGIQCGFLVFLGNRELILECHTWGEIEVPIDFRDRNVVVSTQEGLNIESAPSRA